jgi:hypothetical protein
MTRGRNVNDLVGKRFGKLTVLSFDKIHQKKAYWRVVCDCGNFDSARSDRLTLGRKKSCGCLLTESRKNNLTTTLKNLNEKNEIYEKTLFALLNIAVKENQLEKADMIVSTLYGYDLLDKYKKDTKEGKEKFKEW